MIFRVTKCAGRRSDSWLLKIADVACRPSRSRINPTSSWTASFATPYGLVGWHGVSSFCGLSGVSPKIALEDAASTLISRSSSRTASRILAVVPAIAFSASEGESHVCGTNEGEARWYSSRGCARSSAARSAPPSSRSTCTTATRPRRCSEQPSGAAGSRRTIPVTS